MMTIAFSGAEGRVTVPETLTVGMVGKQIKLVFSDEWKGLAKTAVFRAGNVTRDVVCTGDQVTIPWEVMAVPMVPLYVGVYGVAAGGIMAIPTIRVNCGEILPGAIPSGEAGNEPELSLWAQLQGIIGDLTQLDTQSANTLVGAVNEVLRRCAEVNERVRDGATFTPSVSAAGILSWSNDRGLPNPEDTDLSGPRGEKGEPGMSAFDYAREGGFTGSEESFAQRMAADIYTKEEIDAIMGSYINELDALIGGNG